MGFQEVDLCVRQRQAALLQIGFGQHSFGQHRHKFQLQRDMIVAFPVQFIEHNRVLHVHLADFGAASQST
ncbi:hypothetical protein D3C81_813760 [compost metagenome]